MGLEGEGQRKDHKFWNTQPVRQYDDEEPEDVTIIDETKNIQPDAITKLPNNLKWKSLNLNNDEELTELYILLKDHYVADEDSTFRFAYSKNFLKWALCSPNYKSDWHLGIVTEQDEQLIGFISAIPQMVNVKNKIFKMANVNFLCLHSKYRNQRLAPLLIMEISRRCRLEDYWIAIYTSGTYLPTPITQPKYFHRKLNTRKLFETGFSSIPSWYENKEEAIKIIEEENELPTKTSLKLKKFEIGDADHVLKILSNYFKKFTVHPLFSKEEIIHWFTPIEDVIYSYLVLDKEDNICDFASFFIIPSSVLNNEKHKVLNVAYAFYSAPIKYDLKEIFYNLLIEAKKNNCDVFNALNIQEFGKIFTDLKFGIGTGTLNYYLFNLKCKKMHPSEMGVIML